MEKTNAVKPRVTFWLVITDLPYSSSYRARYRTRKEAIFYAAGSKYSSVHRGYGYGEDRSYDETPVSL